MRKNTRVIAEIRMAADGPTQISFSELFRWIIWQFPTPKGGKLCGAVHPPIAEHGWLPALINPKKKRVEIYCHLEKIFSNPESAADYIKKQKLSVLGNRQEVLGI